MMVRCEVDPGRRGLRLLPVGASERDLIEAVRSIVPSIRARRADGRLLIDFSSLDALKDSGLDVIVDPTAQRHADNRNGVADRADQVLADARSIADGSAVGARALIADSSLADRLDDHQAVNVATMVLPNGWGTCIFDEQGTGKTATVVAAFDLLVERGEAQTLIVVSPKSMVAEWAEEFRKFTGNLYRVAVVDGTRSARARLIDSGANVVVLNYESALSLSTNLELLAKRTRAILAVDEAFFVKNSDASRTRAVQSLREWCGRCFVLCGTPAPNRPDDLVAQFDLVDFGRTFHGVRLDEDRDVAASQVLDVLANRGFFVRNRKADVLPDLPNRTFRDVLVPLAPQQQRAYDAARQDLILDLRAASDADFSRRLTSFLQRRSALLRISSDPAPLVPGYVETPAKITALDELLAEYVDRRGEKVVVWSFYRAALDAIAARYAERGLVRIDGSVTDVAQRREAVRRFQEEANTRIFLGNPAAAGAGLTLHSARVAIYESLSNQAAHFLQSLDRIHRRGQEREVEYVTLLGENTIERGEYERLLQKADRQATLLGDTSEPRLTRAMLLSELLSIGASASAES